MLNDYFLFIALYKEYNIIFLDYDKTLNEAVCFRNNGRNGAVTIHSKLKKYLQIFHKNIASHKKLLFFFKNWNFILFYFILFYFIFQIGDKTIHCKALEEMEIQFCYLVTGRT